MKYNWDNIDDGVAKAIRENYNLYFEMIEVDQSKLRFVKQLKEHTGLGLKEAKENADIIFAGGINLFKGTFGLKYQRRQKLDALKKILLTNELVEMIKNASLEELEEVFSGLDIDTIEDVLNRFLND